MCGTFDGNPYTTIVCYCSPTNDSDGSDITTFYDGLFFLARHIPKHKVLIICGDMNVKIGKNENNKFGLHNLPNRNGEYLIEFSLENSVFHAETLNSKKKGGKIMNLHPPKWRYNAARLYTHKREVDE